MTCRVGMPLSREMCSTSGGDSACSLKSGYFALIVAEQVLVPRERQVGVVPALQQQLVAAEVDRLVDLGEDLLEARARSRPASPTVR